MAIARCESCGWPKGKSGNHYSQKPRLPVNHPQSALVCGTKNCDHPALIWLLEEELAAYQKGQRIFELTGGIRHAKLLTQ